MWSWLQGLAHFLSSLPASDTMGFEVSLERSKGLDSTGCPTGLTVHTRSNLCFHAKVNVRASGVGVSLHTGLGAA